MKIKELIKLLQDEDPERDVVLQSDAEGNGYSPLAGYWIGAYDAEDWEAGIEELTEEAIAEGYTEDDLVEGSPSVFLVPR